MNLDQLTEQHLLEIVRIYEAHCGFGREFREVMYQKPANILESLKDFSRGRNKEYRVGSRWDGHSKIYLRVSREGVVTVEFNSNFAPEDRQGREFEEANSAGKRFVAEAMRYLVGQTPQTPTVKP